jgi:uncharacterized protein
MEIYALPLLKQILVYAPLHRTAAVVSRSAAQRVQQALCEAAGPEQANEPAPGPNRSPNVPAARRSELDELIRTLCGEPEPEPRPRQGPLRPAFLGLIPTRACNLACAYCGFLPSECAQGAMDLALARDVVYWYLDLAAQAGKPLRAEIHFFGGEPFCAPEVLDLVVQAAHLRSTSGPGAPGAVRFEVLTNGTFDERRCQWAADSLDSVILSLDGPAEIQDRQRHSRDGRGSYQAVVRNARILSQGPAELSVRACVTQETVDRGEMPRIASWLCEEFRLASACFEPVQPTDQSARAGLCPPDPWAFARQAIEAARILEAYGVQPVYASSDVTTRRVSFCPVGQDVPVVSPDGTISACYLLERDWRAQGMDLRFGRMEDGAAVLDLEALETTRRLNVWTKPLCRRCFCRWHCAGGCHVNHRWPEGAPDGQGPPAGADGAYDRLCIQTRVIALRNVLKAMGRDDLTRELLADDGALRAAILQPADEMEKVRLPA